MRKYYLFLLCLFIFVPSIAQSPRSIRVYNSGNQNGWSYGIQEIDSMTFDGKNQFIFSHGECIPYFISDVDSVTFTNEEASLLYICTKEKNDPAVYVINPKGYLRITGDSDGNLTELDALIDSTAIISTFDEYQRITSIRSDSMDLYFSYGDENVIFGYCYGQLVYETIEAQQIQAVLPMFVPRKIGESTNMFIGKELVMKAANALKNYLVELGLNKALGIERDINEKTNGRTGKSGFRETVSNLMGMAENIQDIQQYGDMKAIEIVNNIEDKMPEMKGLEYILYFGKDLDPTALCAKMYDIARWVRQIINKNDKIIKQKEIEANRPTVVYDIKTGISSNITDNSADCEIDGIIRAVANKGKFDFDYGICYSTSVNPTISVNRHSNSTSGLVSSISIKLPVSMHLDYLEANTEYYYRAYLRDNISGTCFYANEIKSFTTKNNADTSCPDANHPHMIDLGLPSGTKWACCNVGAHSPEEYGGYYAWGEVSEKDVYNEVTYQYATGTDKDGDGWYDDDVLSYQNLGSNIAGTQYDVAHEQWGGSWVMPSHDQIKELINHCTYQWTTLNGVNGMRFIGSDGGSIFLPNAGARWHGNLYYANMYGYYWSSTQDPDYSGYAFGLYIGSGYAYWNDYGLYRDGGRSVRPVVRN